MKPVHIQRAGEEYYRNHKPKKIGICVKTLFNLKEEQIPSIAMFIEMQKILEADQVHIPFQKHVLKIFHLYTSSPVCNVFFKFTSSATLDRLPSWRGLPSLGRGGRVCPSGGLPSWGSVLPGGQTPPVGTHPLWTE